MPTSLPLCERPPKEGTSGPVSMGFTLVVGLFLTSLLTANVISVKLLDIYGLILPAGVLIFPIGYIAGDVLTEVYGYTCARRVIWLGFLCNLLLVGAGALAQALPPAPFWKGQAAYEEILGYTPRLLLASVVAYLFGELLNSRVMAWMKALTKGRRLWTRTIASTLVGQGADSLLFIGIAFFGTMPTGVLLMTVLTQWLFKTAYEALATPLTYLAVALLGRHEGRAADGWGREPPGGEGPHGEARSGEGIPRPAPSPIPRG